MAGWGVVVVLLVLDVAATVVVVSTEPDVVQAATNSTKATGAARRLIDITLAVAVVPPRGVLDPVFGGSPSADDLA